MREGRDACCNKPLFTAPAWAAALPSTANRQLTAREGRRQRRKKTEEKKKRMETTAQLPNPLLGDLRSNVINIIAFHLVINCLI